MPVASRNPGSGGGGSGGVQVVTVPVSSAEILDLASTDVVLIAGVPGSVVAVQNVAVVYVAGATPYTPGGNALVVATRSLSDPVGTVAFWLTVAQTGIIDQAGSQEKVAGYGAGLIDGGVSDWSGRDVVLFTDVNPTDGDGTLLVTLSYFLAPVV